jgi:dipeptidase
VPAQDWPEGATRKIVANAHTNDGGTVLGTMPQVRHTYRHLMSRYSFMNEKGVAIAESTFGIDTTTDYGKKVRDVMWTKGDGLIDCWMAQDVALERAASAREAVQVMGKLVEEFGFLTETGGGGETMTITDGNETWVAEFYGRDIWAAVRIPEDHLFVAANRARIGEINLADKANAMAATKIVSFAVEQGWFDPSGQAVRGPRDLRARRPRHLVTPRVARLRPRRAIVEAAAQPGAIPVLGQTRSPAHPRGHPEDPIRLLRGHGVRHDEGTGGGPLG